MFVACRFHHVRHHVEDGMLRHIPNFEHNLTPFVGSEYVIIILEANITDLDSLLRRDISFRNGCRNTIGITTGCLSVELYAVVSTIRRIKATHFTFVTLRILIVVLVQDTIMVTFDFALLSLISSIADSTTNRGPPDKPPMAEPNTEPNVEPVYAPVAVYEPQLLNRKAAPSAKTIIFFISFTFNR